MRQIHRTHQSSTIWRHCYGSHGITACIQYYFCLFDDFFFCCFYFYSSFFVLFIHFGMAHECTSQLQQVAFVKFLLLFFIPQAGDDCVAGKCEKKKLMQVNEPTSSHSIHYSLHSTRYISIHKNRWMRLHARVSGAGTVKEIRGEVKKFLFVLFVNKERIVLPLDVPSACVPFTMRWLYIVLRIYMCTLCVCVLVLLHIVWYCLLLAWHAHIVT